MTGYFSPVLRWSLCLTVVFYAWETAWAESPNAVPAQTYERTVAKAIRFLRTQGQNENGSYSSFSGTGVTALITTAILRHGRSADDPLVSRSLEYLQQFIHPDGGIHVEGTRYRNYETCLALLCFAEANHDGHFDKIVQGADGFIKDLQWDGDEGHDKSSNNFGGGGYGKHGRPDMSNTQFLVDALRAAGNDENSEAIQRALIFVSRCQNLETHHNTTPHASKVNDGGFYYTSAAGGSSQGGKTENGGLRSYGSMTYAGLKSMIYAGVGPDDPRVKAAFKWIQKNYDLESNPGLGNAGLFYYYHTFAKALDAIGENTIKDEDGSEHNWRAELVTELAARQQDDGSWINENARWMEGDANLVTGYALLTLSYCRPNQP